MVLCIFMLGRGLSLNRGVTGVRFSSLLLYCLGAGKWVFIPGWRWDTALSGILASLPLTLAAGGLLQQRRLTFHLTLALSRIDFPYWHLHYIWRFCSLALTFMFSNFPPHTLNFTHLHYAVIKPVLISLPSFIILLRGFIIRIFYCFSSSASVFYSVWPCSEMARVHWDFKIDVQWCIR